VGDCRNSCNRGYLRRYRNSFFNWAKERSVGLLPLIDVGNSFMYSRDLEGEYPESIGLDRGSISTVRQLDAESVQISTEKAVMEINAG
jgi:hypothetical protein